jgi:hypothetical protein
VYELTVDLAKLEPTVACHPDPGQRKLAKEWGRQAGPGVYRFLHRRQDERFSGVCAGGAGEKVKIDTFGVPATPEIVQDLQTALVGREDGVANSGGRGRADDGERGLRGLPGRAGGHLRADEFADEVHQRDEPEFPGPDGAQGIAGVSGVAGHGGGERDHREHHRSAGVLELLWALYQFASHNGRVWEMHKPPGYAMRGSGSFINPNNFAGFAEMILPLALTYTVMARLSPVAKVLMGYSGLVMMAGVVVSESRGGNVAMVATLTVFCVVLLFQRDYWRRGVVALGFLWWRQSCCS